MLQVDLNCDLGESFGRYTLGLDEQVLPVITSCNIACGYHASDPLVMEKTVRLAKTAGVSVGAHPGFPDLLGFGRRNLAVSPQEAADYTLYQLGALDAFCRVQGIAIQHVKPHGALYNMAGKDYKLARAIAEAVQQYDPKLILLALSGSQMVRAARDIGLPVAQEVFADRAYEEDGSLVARSKEGAMITDEEIAIGRVVRMVTQGKVQAITGNDIPIEADSVCVHGDGEKALAFTQRIRAKLETAGVALRPLHKFIGM